MTISDKIRIYELSRDLNLENKDILDAAQKLSISVKSHSSSITAEDANKIKNLINKKIQIKKYFLLTNLLLNKRPPSKRKMINLLSPPLQTENDLLKIMQIKSPY